MSEVYGEGDIISENALDIGVDSEADADADAELYAMIEADAKLAALVHVETAGWWDDLKSNF